MKKTLFLFIFSVSLSLFSQEKVSYISVSKKLLKNLIAQKDYDNELILLEKSNLNDLVKELKTDTQKMTFWINIYNAFIQIALSQNPEEYKNKTAFFKKPRIKIASQILSFDDIEHGILRKSKIKISLGYLRKWFRPKWEQELRVKNLDWRIHFALNCGAKSCPPVAIYSKENLNKELEYMTKTFLKNTTTYNVKTNTANTVKLFFWFNADFGGSSSIKKILLDYGATPKKVKKIIINTYDWTLQLRNYKNFPAQI
jgi:hypothetical protein